METSCQLWKQAPFFFCFCKSESRFIKQNPFISSNMGYDSKKWKQSIYAFHKHSTSFSNIRINTKSSNPWFHMSDIIKAWKIYLHSDKMLRKWKKKKRERERTGNETYTEFSSKFLKMTWSNTEGRQYSFSLYLHTFA